MPSDPRLLVADSIENAIAELSVALAELDRMPASDKPMLGFVAHAMNTYVSVTEATLGLIERAVSARPDPEVERWLNGLRHLGRLMQHMVERLGGATTPTEFPLNFASVNLTPLLQRLCDHYRPSAQQKGLEIVCVPVGEVPPVWADGVAIAVVADSLLANALTFSESGGQILVQIMPGPGGVVCGVRDHGRGLTFLEQLQLFEQASAPGTAPPSMEEATGHRLAIAKEFIDRMGGRLWAEGKPGQGTAFFFRLPYPPGSSTDESRGASP